MRSDDDRESGAAANDEGASAVVDSPSARPALSQTIVGWVTAESTLASLHVDFVGNSEGPLPARSAVVLDDAALLRAIAARQQAVLVFENVDARLPIVLGLIAAPPSPLHALLQPEAPAAAAPKER